MPEWIKLATLVVPVANILYIIPKSSVNKMSYEVFLSNGLVLNIKENEAGANWLRLQTQKAVEADSVAACELSGAEWPG